MRDRAIADRIPGDYADIELRTVLATMIGISGDTVCQVAAVVIRHRPDGEHEIMVVNDAMPDRAQLAGVLRHAASHVHGGCRSCRRRNRKAGSDG